MPFGVAAAVGGAAALGGAYLSSQAASDAADQQSASAAAAQRQQQNQFDSVQNQQKPFIQQGTNAINRLGDLAGTSGNISADGYGSLTHQFNANDLQANLSPSYQFQLEQGLGNAKAQYDANGGLVGGNAMQGLNKFAQDYAKTGYQQAYENANTNQNNIYNRLAGIAGVGQTSTNTSATAGAANSSAISNLLTGSAAAQAAGTVGSANAYSQGLSGLGNSVALGSLLNSGIGNTPSAAPAVGNYNFAPQTPILTSGV